MNLSTLERITSSEADLSNKKNRGKTISQNPNKKGTQHAKKQHINNLPKTKAHWQHRKKPREGAKQHAKKNQISSIHRKHLEKHGMGAHANHIKHHQPPIQTQAMTHENPMNP